MRVLVVEDEHKIAQSIKRGLEQESYAVDLAFSETDGVDLATTEDYDLIVLDRLLPGMDGVDVVKSLRAQQIYTPVLMLTAKGQINDRVEGLDAGRGPLAAITTDPVTNTLFCFSVRKKFGLLLHEARIIADVISKALTDRELESGT